MSEEQIKKNLEIQVNYDSFKEKERGNFNISNVPLLNLFENNRKYEDIKTLFTNAEMNTDEATLYGRPTFTFGPELLTMYPRMTGDKAPFKVFKNYRFFSKMYDGEYSF